jgi:hypothetical protein
MRHVLALGLGIFLAGCGSNSGGNDASTTPTGGSGGSGGASAGAGGGESGSAGAAGDLSNAGSSGSAGAAGDSGASGAAGSGGDAPFCGTSGVTKGPLALHVDGTSAVVRWETCVMGSTTISYQPEAGGDPQTAEASVTPIMIDSDYGTILPSIPHDLPGTWLTYEADLTGLTPGTCYAYTVAGDATRVGHVCTSPASGKDFTFLAIADTNPGLGGMTDGVLSQVLPHDPDFTIHGGDIQYYASALETYALWFQLMAPLLQQGAIMPAVGNHESEKPDEYQDYFLRFWGGAGFDEMNEYYRFEYGGVWFFAVNTELDFHADSAQGMWLTSQLAYAQQQPGFRFSIVYQHRPYLTCGDSDEHSEELAGLEPSFLQYGVKLVVQAHMHGYERFLHDGLTFITSGGGGGAISDVNLNVSRPYCNERLVSGAFFHAMVMQVAAGKLTGTAIDDSGAVRDTFTIDVP